MYCTKNCTHAWCSQDPVDFLGNYGPNMGTEKIRNLPAMYSEAEPGSRAGGASEGSLPGIPHHSAPACSQPETRDATACPARTMQPVGSRGCRLRSGSCAVPTSTCPEAAAAPGTRSGGKPKPKNHKHLMQPHLVDRPVGARWRRRPPQAHSV